MKLADHLRELARRARRLPPPSRHDPEAFHIARDELGRDIDRVAELLDRRRAGRDATRGGLNRAESYGHEPRKPDLRRVLHVR